MFEEGARLRAERGADRVFDFTLGNPDVEPPEIVLETLRRVASETRPRTHGYMPNAGFPEVREAIAKRLREHGYQAAVLTRGYRRRTSEPCAQRTRPARSRSANTSPNAVDLLMRSAR